MTLLEVVADPISPITGAVFDVLAKGGPPTVILGIGIWVLWKAYTKKDEANGVLATKTIEAINAATSAIEALTRGLGKSKGRSRRSRR